MSVVIEVVHPQAPAREVASRAHKSRRHRVIGEEIWLTAIPVQCEANPNTWRRVRCRQVHRYRNRENPRPYLPLLCQAHCRLPQSPPRPLSTCRSHGTDVVEIRIVRTPEARHYGPLSRGPVFISHDLLAVRENVVRQFEVFAVTGKPLISAAAAPAKPDASASPITSRMNIQFQIIIQSDSRRWRRRFELPPQS